MAASPSAPASSAAPSPSSDGPEPPTSSPTSSQTAAPSIPAPSITAPSITAPSITEPSIPAYSSAHVSQTPPVARQRRFSGAVYDLFVETFAVVLGVTLALLADGCKQDAEGRARAARVRTSILAEVQANRALVAESRAYHRMLMDSLGARARRDAEPPSPRLFSRGFLHPARVRATAWEAASATGALSLLPYDDVLAFSDLYAAQEAYREGSRNAGRIVYDALFDGGTAGIAANYRNHLSLVSSTWYLEGDLLGAYRSALLAVGADTTAAADSTKGAAPPR